MTMTIINNLATKRAETTEWLNRFATGRATQQESFEVNWADVPSSIPARYEILTQLGTGGTGIVYKVRDLETGEIIALKVLKPGIASDQEMQQNLRKEVCLARKVTHKNVCRIYDFNRSNGMACLSMEFVEGENLLSKLRRVGPLSVDESLEIARQICAGLREAHLQGIVHRDLKPANIMLDRSGVVKIMDFGIARLSQGNGQMTGTIAGTPGYMAPEQVELKPMGPRTDIYSVGLLLYEMVTGSPAFEGDTPVAIALKQIRELPKRPCEMVPTLPAHTEAVILKCLRKDPAKRFQSVDELDAALQDEARTRIAVPRRISLRLPDFKVHRALQQGIEKARAARPRLATFAVEVRRAGREANRLLSHSADKASAFLRSQGLRAARSTRMGPVAATVGLVLLGTVVAFGLETREKNHTNEAAAERSVALSLQNPQSPDRKGASLAFETFSPDDAGQAVTTREVDLNRGFDSASGNESLPEAASPKESPRSEPISAVVKGVKADSRISTPSAARMTSAQGKVRPLRSAGTHTPQPTPAPASITPETVNTMSGQKISDAKLSLSATALPTSTPDPTPKGIDMPNQQKTEESKPVLTTSYLEVGSFKDATWADKAVDQLSRLGFHAVSIHKTHLWMQSYHVQVGPYANPADVEAAQRSLAAQDFKSHLVK
jgi:serine/threonine protein kinase/cell division protein FtsN